MVYKGKVLVAVEVKGGKGSPRFRVNERKMKRIELAMNVFLKKVKLDFSEVRLDVIEVTDEGIVHLEGVEL